MSLLQLACTSSGGPPPPSGPRTIHELEIHRHTSAELDSIRADAILGDATRVLLDSDDDDDIVCAVELRRRGDVGVITVGNGVINSQADFQTINTLPGQVKVVRKINWCSGIGIGILGCAPVPGDSLVVVRYGATMEGILWAHEFGHNQSLHHRTEEGAVMYPSIGESHRRVNHDECQKFETGS